MTNAALSVCSDNEFRAARAKEPGLWPRVMNALYEARMRQAMRIVNAHREFMPRDELKRLDSQLALGKEHKLPFVR
ncbi:MAG: hypothetical protein HY056_03025 [Proteobacteria bacterium]|nr:hypothetical protein [Pseudomonadota bacterium]